MLPADNLPRNFPVLPEDILLPEKNCCFILYIDTLYKSSFTHRFYNPGSSQNGDSSHNSQTWIKGFLCNFPHLQERR